MDDLRERIVKEIETIYDPEIPVNIWELGLIYRLDVGEDGQVAIDMTLTAPACPAAEMLPPEVEQKVAAVPGVTAVTLDLVWDPPWDPERMSEAARLELGFD
jgi:FeS assembly SUF system protein